MDLKRTKTEELLRKAFFGGLRASFRYRYFAEAARHKGMEQIADILEATAQNEAEHARHELEFLNGAEDIVGNIRLAVSGEAEESTRFYPEAAKIADQEVFAEIADFFCRMSKVEAKHEKNFREILTSIETDTKIEGRTGGHSAVEMAQMMLPDQANPAGFVHGGELMKLMDNAAAVVAARHSNTNVVTASVENIEFHGPVRVGDLVIVHGTLIFNSHSSMEVKIEVEAEDLLSGYSGKRRPALKAYFVMVALDQNGKPTKVPPLILSTEQEERLFQEGQERYKMRKKDSTLR